MGAVIELSLLLAVALCAIVWLALDGWELRIKLAEERAHVRRLDQANGQLRTDLNHICEHRACRLARRIGLT